MAGAADHRLAVYGTLAPGAPNNSQLDGLAGRWTTGFVCGRLIRAGWGTDLGFPGLVLDPDGSRVYVDVFESPDLVDHWTRLDAFEGSGYRRVMALVTTPDAVVQSWIYVVAAP